MIVEVVSAMLFTPFFDKDVRAITICGLSINFADFGISYAS